jgi:hypothetical protein
VGGAADLGEWNPEGALAPAAVTDLLCAVKSASKRRAMDGVAGFFYAIHFQILFTP